ncbi:ABC transporter ATP-binding protein [Microvirga subterranea]|uniref:Carbohydrate ABC transporter ATP-binding protein (CUT1 family) n=1 Tax=Microvirga subterranea TaxID=186651 RepID=A0A370HTB5_9HYPH|nr:sn-glycerol-3-phosphate ABC transporter ATP-binding protein UgpC [Microvirga subterranea]RDI61758.1 carbohydrate ABC transporter ATP-binding protein (CUT1 family) [Microvirga subterranea]
MATIALDGVVKRYGKTTAVHGIDLNVADGEFVVLVGPSGCGKSTTLRMIAGLEDISGGTISIDGRIVNEAEPKDRNIAMVFQNYAIYPHMSVAQNIGFGLYTSKLSEPEKKKRIQETAGILGLENLLDRRPSQLSGGQRQRVAIGRAMVRDPAAFLFDEPLSNLDAQLRTQMRLEIKKLHQRLGTTIVFVTHDQVEAMTMADRIVVMRDGRILQVGTPIELYENPADVFTARFIGSPTMNLLPARLSEKEGQRVAALNGFNATAHLPGSQAIRSDGADVLVGVRPHDLHVGSADGANNFTLLGEVSVVEPLGSETLVHLDLGGTSVIASAPGKTVPKVGGRVTVHAQPGSLYLFDAKTERALCRM